MSASKNTHLNTVDLKSWSPRAIRAYLILLCAVAGIRVFLGSTCLPLFNDVDEGQHFDLVSKYARGVLPDRTLTTWENETAQITFYFCTFEYLHRPEKFKEFDYVYPPPIWKLSKALQEDLKVKHTPALLNTVNHESQSPPLYYVVAAVWYRVGKLIGLNEPHSAYWVRMLNIPLQILLVVAAHRFCRTYFTDAVACCVPAMVAAFPSTIFFSINNDVLCPLLVLVALWKMLSWYQDQGRTGNSVLAGLAVAACLLTKLTNIAVALVCVFVIAAKLIQGMRRGELGKQIPSAAALVFWAFVPFLCWMIYNRVQIGDWTGTSEKVRHLGWTPNSWEAIWSHPLWTRTGQQAYWTRFCTSFFAGDMNWHGDPWMRFFPLNVFAWISFVVAVIGIVSYVRKSIRPFNQNSFLQGIASTIMILGSIVFLWYLSVRFDFGACVYPSRNYPYFNSGRLAYGILVPFLAFFSCGVETLTGNNKRATALLLAVSILILVPAQVMLFQQSFGSQSNWFHTPL